MKCRCFALVGAAVVMLTGSAGAAGPLREVSGEAGLDRVEARGAARVDFDGDGALDLMLVTQKGLGLYRNQQGRFEASGVTFGRTGDGVSGAAWGDFDGDGDPDLFTVSRDGASRLYRNDGGAFVDVAGWMGVASGGGMAAAWGDFDGDGDLDLVVGRVGALLLYRNEGGGFAEVGGALGLSGAGLVSDVFWVDFDGDGDLDLFCSGPRFSNLLYRNEGRRFTEVGQEAGVAESRTTRAGAWGDFDGDGDPDLYLVDGSGPNRLLRNDGGRFTDVAGQAGVTDAGDGVGAAWIDFDNDGDLDLHLINLLGPDRLFRNEGGRFTDVAPALGIGGGEVVNAVWGDFDGDGAPDLFEARVGTAALYRGAVDGNEALTVRVAGPAGARVTALINGVRQVREAQDGMAVFGLGRQAGIVNVKVTWPDGGQRSLISSEVSRTLRAALDDRLPEMALETEGVAFGEVEQAAESFVTVANRGASPMTLRTARVNHAAFQAVATLPLVIPPGGEARLPVRFTPGMPGPQAAALTLQTDDPWRGQRSIPLTATAAVPDLDAPKALAFEVTPVGQVSSSSVTIFNRGLRPLTLSDASVRGPFQAEVVAPIRVPVGASASIPVRFRPTRAGQAADSLFFTTDDPDRPRAFIALSGRGRGTPVARLSASDMDFGRTPMGSARSLRLTLSNEGDDDLNVAQLSVPEPFRVAGDPFVLPAGKRREIEVGLLSDRRGDVAGALTLTLDDPARPTLAVSLKGWGTAPRTRLSSAALDFGEVMLEKNSKLPVTLFNDGDADLVVSQMASEHPMFAVSDGALTVPPGASATLTVTYSPYWKVPVTGRVLLTTSDPEHPQTVLAVSGTGIPRGPQARLTLEPSTDGGVRVAVSIEDAPALTGYAVTLRFDPTLLRFDGASVRSGGGLLGAETLEVPPLVQDNVVTFGGARLPSAGAAREGKGLLGVVTFRPTEGLTAGRETPLKVEKVLLRGPGGGIEGRGTGLTIQGAVVARKVGDLNGNGQVDLDDFFALSAGFGKRSGEPGFDRKMDLNGDGKIDLEDLFILQDGMKKK